MLFRRTLLTAMVFLVLGPAGVGGQSASMGDDYDGAAATGLALRRLGTTARVLHIGAHPDDENTALFAPLALGRGVDAAYLSLTRGEGGQNGIGPELGVALGVIRSEELLAARRLDGGAQFFTRAIDYGYSKEAAEAFRHWPRDTLLADVVAIIRRYRPDVVASVWSGTSRDGHGQHEASGIIAREATLAAGDPTRFPDQIAAGLRPHGPALYYRSAWFSDDPPDVELNTGALDPLLGASYHQLAMASRSRHRSQDQGRSLTPGPRHTSFDRVDPAAPVEVAEGRSFGRYGEGPPGSTASLFEGVDTLLSQRADRLLPRTAAARPLRERVLTSFREYEALVRDARDRYTPLDPGTLLPSLVRAGRQLETAIALLAGMGSGPADGLHHLAFHARAELEDVQLAIRHAANVRLDVVAEEPLVIPGQTFRLELSVWNGGEQPVTAGTEPRLPAGWSAVPVEGDGTLEVDPGERGTAVYTVTVPDTATPTMPYYLDPHAPRPDALYRWPDDPALRGLPFGPPPVRGAFALMFDGVGPNVVTAELEATHVAVDARDGQYREPVKVVPAVSVGIEPGLAVFQVNGSARPLPFSVRLRSQSPDTVTGELRLDVPAGWTPDPTVTPVRLAPGAGANLTVRVTPGPGVEPGEYEVGAHVVAGEDRYELGYDVVAYPHIAPHHFYERARTRVRALEVDVAGVRVGYVAGAGDGVPGALDQLGVEWAPLDTEDLAGGDLSRFDVIVTGIRAYEVRDDLPAHNQRLLDWVRDGGTLIVQYNKYPALDRDYAPWPVTIDRPHGRVTDETAPVTVLEPRHPAFTTPNPIGPADWEGWVQERGLYFWESWEGPLTPLLALADPGEEPLTGGLLVAPLGEGTYVYTGLAFFRQLPEGVPGAYRLFANLISLGDR